MPKFDKSKMKWVEHWDTSQRLYYDGVCRFIVYYEVYQDDDYCFRMKHSIINPLAEKNFQYQGGGFCPSQRHIAKCIRSIQSDHWVCENNLKVMVEEGRYE